MIIQVSQYIDLKWRLLCLHCLPQAVAIGNDIGASNKRDIVDNLELKTLRNVLSVDFCRKKVRTDNEMENWKQPWILPIIQCSISPVPWRKKKSLPTRYSNLKIKSPFMKREEYYQTLCNISFPLIYMTPIPDDEEENVSKWKVSANHFHSSAAATYKRRSGTQSSSHNSLISSSEEHPNSRKNEIRKLFLYFQVLFD